MNTACCTSCVPLTTASNRPWIFSLSLYSWFSWSGPIQKCYIYLGPMDDLEEGHELKLAGLIKLFHILALTFLHFLFLHRSPRWNGKSLLEYQPFLWTNAENTSFGPYHSGNFWFAPCFLTPNQKTYGVVSSNTTRIHQANHCWLDNVDQLRAHEGVKVTNDEKNNVYSGILTSTLVHVGFTFQLVSGGTVQTRSTEPQ